MVGRRRYPVIIIAESTKTRSWRQAMTSTGRFCKSMMKLKAKPSSCIWLRESHFGKSVYCTIKRFVSISFHHLRRTLRAYRSVSECANNNSNRVDVQFSLQNKRSIPSVSYEALIRNSQMGERRRKSAKHIVCYQQQLRIPSTSSHDLKVNDMDLASHRSYSKTSWHCSHDF